MMSVELEEQQEWAAFRKPMLLDVGVNQTEAKCPNCVKPINDDYPPQEHCDNVCCPHCMKPLNIQCKTIDEETTFGSMNEAQHINARESFKRLGAVILKMESGNYHLLFGGVRKSYSENISVVWAYNQILQELADMKGVSQSA